MQAACMLHQERAIVKPESARISRTQAERRAHTRGALIAAGRRLFAAEGYVGAGREDIVEAAGVTRGAMYHHFASKQDLFRAVYEAVESDLCASLARAAMGATDPVEQLRRGSLRFLDAAASPEVRRIVLLDAPSVLPVELRRTLSEQYGLGLVREALRAADAVGRLRVRPADAFAPVLLAALHEAATGVADGADPAAVRAVVEGLIQAVTSH